MGAAHSSTAGAAAPEQHPNNNNSEERAAAPPPRDSHVLAAAAVSEEEDEAFQDAVENLADEDSVEEEQNNLVQQQGNNAGPVVENVVEQNIMDRVAEELDGLAGVRVAAVAENIRVVDNAGAVAAVPGAGQQARAPARRRRRNMRDLDYEYAMLLEADAAADDAAARYWNDLDVRRRGGEMPRAAPQRRETDGARRTAREEVRRAVQVLDRELERVQRAHRDMVANMGRITPPHPPPPPPVAVARPRTTTPYRTRDRYKKMLEDGRTSWANVPQELREDEGFARSITTLPRVLVLRAIFESHPALARDRYYWKKIFGGNTVVREDVCDLFVSSADQAMLDDGELMRAACRYSPRFQQMMEGPRAKDRYFWKALLDEDPFVLRNLPFSIQRRYPDLVFDALAVLGRIPLPKEDMHMLYELTPNMVPEFWHDRENLRKWFTAGLMFREWQVRLPAALKDDRDVFRWIAEHCRSGLKVDSFDMASAALRSDKQFMLECVTFDPRVLKCAIGPMRTDFDLALAACAGPRELVATYLEEVRFRAGQAKFLRAFHPRVRNMVHSNQSFHPVVLRGMTSCSGSLLATLNENVKKIIAEDFLDVSTTATQAKFVGPATENLDAIRGVPTTVYTKSS